MGNLLIYTPSGRAREYARLACNVYRGCEHGCVYCYAPAALRMDRGAFISGHTRGNDFIERLERDASKAERNGTTGQVLLSFTCDPYQPIDRKERVTRQAIEVLHKNHFSVCVLTKGGAAALRDLDLFTGVDSFAVSLTCLDDDESRKWEPNAPLPKERMDTLRTFYEAGIPTWASLEPVLDPSVTLQIIRETHDYTGLYKVGKLNHHPHAKEIDWHKFGWDAIIRLASLGYRRITNPDAAEAVSWSDRWFYIKRDLAQFLDEHERGDDAQSI